MRIPLKKIVLLICIALTLSLSCAGTNKKTESNLSDTVNIIPSGLPKAVIDPTMICIEKFEGWGTSLAWWANIVGNWPEKERNKVVNLMFGSDNLDLNIARYNIGASPDPNTDQSMRPGGAVPCFTTSLGVYDWNKDKAQRNILLAAKKYGANIFEAFANSPPWWMTWTGDAGGQAGSSFCGPNLRPEHNETYADFLVEVVKHFRDAWGITFRTVEPFNEPNSGWWCASGGQEGCFFEVGQQDLIIRLLGKKLKDKRLSTVVAAPDTSAVREAINNYRNGYSDEARSYIGQINTHTYNPDGDTTLEDIAANDGKRLWMSEFGLGIGDCQSMDGAMALTQHIISDLYDLCPSAWIAWQPVGFGGCDGNWGFVIVPWEAGGGDFIFTRQYHAMRNFTRFIHPGSRIITSGYNKAVAAYHPKQKTLSIVAFNEKDHDYSFVFDLSKFTKTGDSVFACRTSRDEDFVTLPRISISHRKFVAKMKAKSVTSFFISNVDDNLPDSIKIIDDCVKSGPIHFDYKGNWQNCTLCGDELYASSNTWSSVPDDYVTIDFVGSMVTFFGVCDPGHGIAAISVDGGKETEIDFYSDPRTGNKLLFEKKWKFPTKHRLKIRVTGRKNPNSHNCVIAIDKIVVFR